MIAETLTVIAGLALLAWSAGLFVDGAAAVARHMGMPPLMIGMIIVGFGTSAPEMMVSALASMQGNPGIALGNAYGSNIANIAVILGLTAVICPLLVQSRVLRKELPILVAVTALGAFQLSDGEVSRIDAACLLAVFGGLVLWSIIEGRHKQPDALGTEIQQELTARKQPVGRAWFRLVLGLVLLIISSRMLVWGAVGIARGFGVSDLVIGLTIVAIGTSLPELASSIVAVRKGEHDIAIGNVIGSNLFNTLAVVGIAAAIHPTAVPAEVIARDIPVMAALTVCLFILGFGFKGPGRINRFEGAALMVAYAVY
ncbi:MAG: calcium/sodium antiporter, partial [Immundisolibacter sp.]|uniref:calcium/sodium antiporter n=1 Tax=Immundisolibacter sp. TaxID=1934948 RepID=UPI003EE36B8F